MLKKIWKNKVWRIVFIVITFLVVFFIIGYISNQNKIDNLETALSDISLEKLKVDGDERVYDLKKGKVFRGGAEVDQKSEPATVREVLALVAFHQSVLEDPLFTAPRFNSIELKKSVDELEAVDKEFLNAGLIDTSIFPINFLRELIKTSETEKTFFEGEIRYDEARQLLDQYNVAQQSYLGDSDRLASFYSDKVDTSSQSRFVFLNVVTSAGVVKDDLDKIVSNSEQLKNQILNHEKCLEAGDCSSRAAPEKPTLDFTETTEPKILPEEDLFTREFIDSPRRGPYEVSTPCFGWSEQDEQLVAKSYPFYVVDTVNPLSEKRLETTFLKMTNQVYFRKLNKDDPFDAERIGNGQNWSWFGETNSYMCPDLSYQAVLATMDFYQENYKEPILVDLETILFGGDEAEVKEMVAFENKFYLSSYVSEENFNKLKDVYFSIYSLIRKHGLDSNEVPSKDKILERSLVMDRKLGGYHKIINRVLLTVQATLIRDKEIVKEQKIGLENFLLSFLSSRSTYSLLFFPFTESVWRGESKLDNFERGFIDIVGPNKEFMTIDQARKNYLEAEIRSWYTVFVEQIIQKK